MTILRIPRSALLTRPAERIYCLTRCQDGRWLALNRDYVPYGERYPQDTWVDYNTCSGTRLSLTERQLRRLDGGCRPYKRGDRKVWLFHDGCQPDDDAASLAMYLRRLAVLDEMVGVA